MKTIKSFLLSVILIIALVNHVIANNTESWRNDQSCGDRYVQPKLATIAGCGEAYCTEMAGTHICACRKTNDDEDIKITVKYENTLIKQWTTKVMPIIFGKECFRIYRVDLDGDGKDEILFGIMASQSNGMGIEYWTVWAIDHGNVSDPIDIEDYGTMGFATRPTGVRSCKVLVSRWLEGWEPRRGAGLYIVGRWYDYVNGDLVPDYNRPAIYSRYLYNLERKRGQSLSKKQILWYQDKNAQSILGPYPFK